jgi:hypothetical protein
MSYLDDIDPTPTTYQPPRWITTEARRIRRERYAAWAESVLLGVVIGLGIGLVLAILQVV